MADIKFDLQALVNFVQQNGESFERSFLYSLVDRKYCEDFTEQIKTYQNDDGGWVRLDADYKGTVSSITCTIMALSKLNCLNLRNELYEKTYMYLKNCQHAEGFWDESREIMQFMPPSWFYPNNENNKIWFTNGLSRYLISLRCDDQELLSKARNYVKQFNTESGIQGYDHNNWMGIVTFDGQGDPVSNDIKEKSMKNLYDKCKDFDCYNLLWALESLISLNLGLDNPVVKKFWDLLQQCKQGEDGGFYTEAGDQHRVDLADRILYTSLKLGVVTPEEIKF